MNIEIDKKAALAFMSVRGKPAPETEGLLDECIGIITPKLTPRYVLELFPAEAGDGGVYIGGVFFGSRDLSAHLKGAREAAVLAATVGPGVDMLINRYVKTDVARAYCLSACGSAAIETLCDRAEAELMARRPEASLMSRYSPGYGDLGLICQKDIMRITRCGPRIGLTLTDSLILVPSKSVTAIIGMKT